MGGVYIHIPFCRTHCTYCGFYSELLRSSQGSESFVSALCSEITGSLVAFRSAASSPVAFRSVASPVAFRSAASPVAFRSTAGSEVTPPTASRRVPPPAARGVAGLQNPLYCLHSTGEADTLYFGGGTPSLLSLEQLSRIVDAVGIRDFAEFTIEVNPDDIVRNGREYAEGLRRLGVSRVSMGVQSFDDVVLKRMGRRHNAAEAVKAYEMLREAGFGNISLDFIFGFVPGMSARILETALESLPGGVPEHLSCYQLSIEEGSGLEKMVSRGIYEMPSDEECERQYYDLCSALRDMGYEHYEISNWARPGRRSRHNSSYWNHTPYVGFGPGAHSLFVNGGDYVRRWNNPDLTAYLDAAGKGDFNPVRGSETLTAEQIEEERIMLGLRTSDGIAEACLDSGYLVPSALPGHIRIPEDKWFIADTVIGECICNRNGWEGCV